MWKPVSYTHLMYKSISKRHTEKIPGIVIFPVFLVLASITSVSYTHLDVYKRQDVSIEIDSLKRSAVIRYEAVTDEKTYKEEVKIGD